MLFLLLVFLCQNDPELKYVLHTELDFLLLVVLVDFGRGFDFLFIHLERRTQFVQVDHILAADEPVNEILIPQDDALFGLRQFLRMCFQKLELQRRVRLVALDDDDVSVGGLAEVDRQVEYFFVLLAALLALELHVLEDPRGGRGQVALAHAVDVADVAQQVAFVVEPLERLVPADVVEADDAVGDAGGFEDADDADLAGVVAVRAAAGLGVDALDLDDADVGRGDRAALLEVHAPLELGVLLVVEGLGDPAVVVHDFVGAVFDGAFLLVGDVLVVRDVDVGVVLGLLRAVLPAVRTEDVAAGGEDDVRGGVVRLELVAVRRVDAAGDGAAGLHGLGQLAVEHVRDAGADLLAVEHRLLRALDGQRAAVALLAAAGRLEAGAVEDHDVARLGLGLRQVVQGRHDSGVEGVEVGLRQLQHFGRLDLRGVLELRFDGLRHFLLHERDFVVEVVGDVEAGGRGDLVGGDALGLHAQDPVVDVELPLLLLEQFLQFLVALRFA